MAKIIFNNKNYEIDPASLSEPIANLESHLSTVMSGTGATIKFGDSSYNIDSTKLSNATNTFVTHLGTIAGNGTKVVVNGVVYNVDSTKTSGAVADLETVLGGLNVGGGDASFPAGLYQTGAIALYNEQGAEAIEGMLITPWDELVESGAIIVDNGAVYVGNILPDNLPQKNEYGFYYGVQYWTKCWQDLGLAFYEDGSVEIYSGGELAQTLPAGSAIYSDNKIDCVDSFGILQVSAEGKYLGNEQFEFVLGSTPAQLGGDLVMPNDDSITIIDDLGFALQQSLTGVVIPDSVTNIGYQAFNYCIGLTDIVIPDSVTNIGYEAFLECSNLTNLAIGNGVTGIDYGVFSWCESLENVKLPDGLTNIGESAFSDCTSLTSIVIPDSVTSIGDGAFFECSGLLNITFEGTADQWRAIEKGQSWYEGIPATYVQCSDGNESVLPPM